MPPDRPVSMESLPPQYRALVIGAGGGLGGAFMTHLKADTRCAEVRGLGRHTEPAVDFLEPDTVSAAAAALEGEGPWHLIVVATGVLHGPQLRPEKRLADLDAQALGRVLAVNTIGPALVLRHFAPRLDRSRSLMGLLSAKVGSIGDNRLGGWYAYRASKAALNMLVKTAAIELRRTHPGACITALHPGTVASALSRPFRGDEIGVAPALAAQRLLGVVDGLKAEDSGGFFSWDGQALPW